jgi:hypothetical protein
MFLVQVFAIFVYDVIYDIVYNIVCQMYDIVCKTYDIVYEIKKNCNIAIFVYDVAYDIVYNIVTFADIAYDHIAIIRYRITISYAISLFCYIARQYRKKTYDVTVRCRIRFSLQVPGTAFAAGRTGHAPGAPKGLAS